MRPILNYSSDNLTYEEWKARCDNIEKRIYLYAQISMLPTDRVEFNSLESVAKEHADLTKLKADYPEYLI